MKQCFKCGRPATRESRFDDNLKVDPSQDLRPVCKKCVESFPDAPLCIKCAEKAPYHSRTTGKTYKLCTSCAWDGLMEALDNGKV